jgi:hypothetical protein
MAQTTYQSPVINTAPKRTAAYDALTTLFQHIKAGTGGYTMDLVQADFGVTTAQRVTVTLTAALPNQVQIDRYGLTVVAGFTRASSLLAQTTYQSPIIDTAPKRTLAYDSLSTLFQHLRAGTGGYTMDLVSADFGLTVAQRVTLVLTDQLPNQIQIDRYNLTSVS